MTSVAIDVSAVPARPAGAGRYVVELARRVAGAPELEVVLVSRRDDAARWRSLAPAGRVTPVAPAGRVARVAWEQLLLGRTVDTLGRGGHPVDVLHAPHYTMPLRSGVPVVVTVHDLTFFDHPEWHERSKVLLFRHAMRRAATRAAAIVCVSQATADRLADLLAPSVPVHVVPHGVDTGVFTPADGGAEADRQAVSSYGVREPYVLHVGTIEPRKDVPTLLEAFAQVAARDRDVSLVLAGGTGWGTGPVEEAMARLRLRDRVARLGYVEDSALPALVRRAAVVAYPSREEGFGLPVLEALACGTPVVTTSGTVMAHVVGEAARLVPAGDPSALAGAITEVMAGGAAVARRRELGLSVAAGQSWERSAEAHAQVYREVAGRNDPRHSR